MRKCRRRHETVGKFTKGESEMKLSLRLKLLSQGAILLFSASSASMSLAAETVEVYKSASCGCCSLWVEHMKRSGFSVEVHDVRNVAPFRERFGVPDSVSS